jgi:drug/metabolite transporter (DMT)-like permease
MSGPPRAAPRLTDRPPARDVGLLLVAVAAVSFSGPLVVAMAVPALAIAFWRNALGVLAIAGFVALKPARRHEVRRLERRELGLSLLAGLFLAGHFAFWIPSLRLTSVASSVALVCLPPVWVVLYARVRGQVVPGRAWLGIAIAFSGVLVLTGVDAGRGGEALLGDLLALLGGMCVAAYTVVGGEVRRSVSTSAYTLVCYSACAAILLVACLLGGVPFGGYGTADWARLLLLTVLAQLLGHTVVNVVLRTTSPTVVSMAILFEVPGAIIVAALLVGQTPPLAVLPAVALLLGGIALVVSEQPEDLADPDPPG